MVTTLQVRNIMHRYINDTYGLYTNKTKGDTSNIRRVKCYMPHDAKKASILLGELRSTAGAENVNVTDNFTVYGSSRPGITVRCILE